jgi:hypothetical protein
LHAFNCKCQLQFFRALLCSSGTQRPTRSARGGLWRRQRQERRLFPRARAAAFRIHTNSKRMQIAPSTIMRVDRITDDAECSQPRLLQGQRELFGHCPAVSSCLLVADEWWPVNCGDGRRTPGSFPVNGQAGAGAAHQPTDRGNACVLGRRERERARDIDEAPDQFAQLGGGRWQIRHRHAVGSPFCGDRAMASHASRGGGERDSPPV